MAEIDRPKNYWGTNSATWLRADGPVRHVDAPEGAIRPMFTYRITDGLLRLHYGIG
jgi:hypothetical protein